MALLEPKTERLAPESTAASPDAAPAWVATGTPEPLRGDLIELLGADRVLTRASDIVRYASDASPYRLFPKAIVMAHDAADVSKVIAYGRRTSTPVVFRAGGTSLNGQGQTDGILIDVRRHFRGVAVEDDGTRVRVKPGTLLGDANRVLAPYGHKLGPDPASTDIACVGGVLANNSGGMRCGVTYDSYETVRELSFVLPSGTAIDTAGAGAEQRFAEAEPELAAGLLQIRDEILADGELVERIRRKYSIKNTTGYRLCAFLDAETPLEIFRRLLIGSEGTLGFIAEAVFETVRQPAMTTVAWLHFPSVDAALEPVQELVGAGARAVELMVAPALIVASYNIRGTPESWRELDPFSAALLVEFGGGNEGELEAAEVRAAEVLAGRELIREPEFHRDAETIEVYWTVREGMHGLVGKMRAPGTALIVEDVCVPPSQMAEMAKDLQGLLTEHGFLPGVAGHASAGNLHFMLTPDFAKPEDLGRYDEFMEGLIELVIDRYDGSLKAEHGTGVNMAPFVEREWGPKATELMRRIKRLADPDGVLGPGVLINDDPGVHLRNLKTTPSIEAEVDTCVECGFCEPVCPSRHLTTTPRQRIVLRREMARQAPGSPVLEALLDEFEYDAIQTCAADSACLLACPVGIDTGKFVKELRADPAQRSRAAARAAPRGPLGRRRARRAGKPGRRQPRPGSAGGRARRDPGHALGAELRAAARVAAQHALPGAGDAARDESPDGRRRLHAGLRQPDLRPGAGARRRPQEPRRGTGRRVRAGRSAALDPARRRRALLRDALDVEGVRARGPADGQPHDRRPVAVERGRRAPRGLRRELVHSRAHRRRRRAAQRDQRRAPRPDGDPRLDRVGERSAAAAAARGAQARRRDGAPAVREPPPGARRFPRVDRGGARGRCHRADRFHLLRVRRRPRDAAPRAPAGGDRRRGGGDRRAGLRCPHVLQSDL